jgi:hypothetical protein
MLFVLLFHIKFTGILYVHGTSKAFYTANEFQSFPQFYLWQLIVNIKTLLYFT